MLQNMSQCLHSPLTREYKSTVFFPFPIESIAQRCSLLVDVIALHRPHKIRFHNLQILRMETMRKYWHKDRIIFGIFVVICLIRFSRRVQSLSRWKSKGVVEEVLLVQISGRRWRFEEEDRRQLWPRGFVVLHIIFFVVRSPALISAPRLACVLVLRCRLGSSHCCRGWGCAYQNCPARGCLCQNHSVTLILT